MISNLNFDGNKLVLHKIIMDRKPIKMFCRYRIDNVYDNLNYYNLVNEL